MPIAFIGNILRRLSQNVKVAEKKLRKFFLIIYRVSQEYSFKPSTLAIELNSGESSEAVFEATRVAYRF